MNFGDYLSEGIKIIKSSDILCFIKDKSIDLPKEELERIINEELEKPENEMDTDLIEYCLDALNELDSEKVSAVKEKKVGDSNEKVISRRFRRAAAVAAAAIFLFIGAVSVSAFIFDVNPFDGIVELYNDHIRIRFDKSNANADNYKLLGSELAKELADNGISPVLLPEALLSDKTKITKTEYQISDVVISANINFVYGKEKGHLTIDYFDSIDFFGESEYPDAKNIVQLDVSGIYVYVFEQNGNGSIAYKDGKSQYGIFSSMTYEQAIEFAKTIK